MKFVTGPIDGVVWRPLQKYHDPRGWLCELYRCDETPEEYLPAMAYISQSDVNIARGPHEHRHQADYFCFFGPSDFQIYLWDNRPGSKTYWHYFTEVAGESKPMAVIVPPGVVHAYKNVGGRPGLVFNCPNKLFRGPGRTETVDEIRHEVDPASPFKLE